MLIQHSSPPDIARKRKLAVREGKIAAGMMWQGNRFQTGPTDRVNVAGRAAKLNALLALGKVQLDATEYTDADGQLRSLVWRTEDNQNQGFSVQGFLEFAVAMDEFVEQQYIDSWADEPD